MYQTQEGVSFCEMTQWVWLIGDVKGSHMGLGKMEKII